VRRGRPQHHAQGDGRWQSGAGRQAIGDFSRVSTTGGSPAAWRGGRSGGSVGSVGGGRPACRGGAAQARLEVPTPP
jgi:hypothetical protein